MTTNDRIHKAIEAIQAETKDLNAPPEVLEQTMTALHNQYGTTESQRGWAHAIVSHCYGHWRWAAAAIVLLMLGFTVGQFSVRGQVRRQLSQWQTTIEHQVTTQLQQQLLQNQQAQLIQVADHFNQGLNQRFNEFAIGLMATSQVTQQQLLDALAQVVYRNEMQQQKRLAQLVRQLESQQLYNNAFLADNLLTVANATQVSLRQTNSLLNRLSPEQQDEQTPFIKFDPNEL